MRLATYIFNDRQHLGVIQEKKVYDLQQTYFEYCSSEQIPAPLIQSFHSLLEMLAAGEQAFINARKCVEYVQKTFPAEFQKQKGLVHNLDEINLQAPVSNPGKLIAIGGNFPSNGKLTKPDFPPIFLKPASSITGPGKPVLVSNLTASVSYEVELAVIIGQTAHRVSETEAINYVGGYCLANDIGDRLLEKRTSQWTTGKMFDTFTPMGSFFLTRDELPDTHALTMETRVNGQLVQKGSTASMFFDVPQLVSYLSCLTTLFPGDIILTGSPKLIDGETAVQVALKPGDTVIVAIEGLGELVNPVEAEPE